MTREIMDIKELANYLGFSETKIYRLVEDRRIPFARIGRQYRFVKSAIDEWLTNQAKGETPYRSDLEQVNSEPDPLTRRLLLVGLLTKELEPQGIKPVIVGGQAVEFYTVGGYATKDIDLVSPRADAIGDILVKWGFGKEGRFWFNDDLGISIEVPSAVLAGDMDKGTVVEIDNLKVYVIGIEDIIIDRMNAFVHWKSSDDRAWAKELMMLNKDDIDWNYLEKRAAEDKTLKETKKLEKEIQSSENS